MKGDKPTFKQKLFARKYVELRGKGTQAAMEVYDTKKKHNAKALAHQNLEKPVVQREIKKVMEEAGLSLDTAGKDLRSAITQGIESGKATMGDALRGLDMVFKLHNAYPAARSIKLSYSKHEQVASKEMQAVVDDLKQITQRASTLLQSSE